MLKKKFTFLTIATAAILACTGIATAFATTPLSVDADSESIEDEYDWGTLEISGGGFVSSIVTGDTQMYARTDVGGAYRYDYDSQTWVQLLDFLTEADRGLLSVDAIAVDPTDDNTIYMLCGCAYFSDARTVIFRSHDAGETFDQIDVTDLVQVHGNGYGRQCGEAIAVDPDNPDIIYCGGDVAYNSSGLIMSEDGGDTWKSVDGYSNLGFFSSSINWPTWENHIVHSNTSDSYENQNGVACIAITGGKVYVGTSSTGTGNVAVADVGSDNFTTLSSELPTSIYPSRINLDADGNLLICYIGGLTFTSSPGAAYRYNTTTGTLTDISPTSNSIGAVYSDPNDANKLVACTCAVWYSQLWYEDAWNDDNVCWGDEFFKSTDGGATWTEMTPGNAQYWAGPLMANYLQDGGVDWIRNNAIHWAGAIVLDPRDPDRFLVTSGNGVFACDDTWDEIPTIYFHADGIEEVVALDFASSPNGLNYSAIGDYDGFIHYKDGTRAQQYSPRMDSIASNASTVSIAYCPTDPNVMVRSSESDGKGFYSLDAGVTWTQLSGSVPSGATASINQLDDGSYRIIMSSSYGGLSYTDDFGQTWSSATISGTQPSSRIWTCPDAENPKYVYAYGYNYNAYDPNASNYYILMVSSDYGKTFTTQNVCTYDGCDSAYRIAYLEEGTIALAGGWYGAYLVENYGSTITKLDSVYYCKTMGYGIGENDGDPNALYMYGMPSSSDAEGIYRSTDCGKTWVLINSEHLYGGTGNGNFLVGDMTEFGTVYMSTVGCGIVVGSASDGDNTSSKKEPTVTTTQEPVVEPSTETSSETEPTMTETTEPVIETTEPQSQDTTPDTSVQVTLYGDVVIDGKINLADVIYLSKAPSGIVSMSDQQNANGDCDASGNITINDAIILMQFQIGTVSDLPA